MGESGKRGVVTDHGRLGYGFIVWRVMGTRKKDCVKDEVEGVAKSSPRLLTRETSNAREPSWTLIHSVYPTRLEKHPTQ